MEARVGRYETKSRCPEDAVFQGSASANQTEGALTHPVYHRADASESFPESGSLWRCLVWILIIEVSLAALLLAG